jgi:peptidoglycan hydrolase-like protein with peptidoglycan-binding domain
MYKTWRGLLLGYSLAAFSGCGSEFSSDDDLTSDVSDLRVGSAGRRVEALHAYLTTYGYFPNPALAAAYPAWRPLSREAPANPAVYDKATEWAVHAFQRNFGLPQTGVVDEPTRALLAQPRCGVPDGIEDLDSTHKFDVSDSTWSGSALSWKLINTDDVDFTSARNAVAAAFATWTGPTKFTFTDRTGTSTSANIEIRFSSKDPNGNAWPSGAVAGTKLPNNGGDVWLNTAVTWSIGGATDLETVVLHELGHSLGIQHSSFPSTVMYGVTNGQKRQLTPDDNAAGLVKKAGFTPFDSTSIDIDVDNGTGFQTIFVTAEPARLGGWSIWRLDNAANWTLMPDGAVRIASHNQRPWAVNDSGTILRWNLNTGSWDRIAGCAKDIGVGADGSVWTIGCNSRSGGFAVNKFLTLDGVNGTWSEAAGSRGGMRISVGPRQGVAGVGTCSGWSSTMVPWIVDDAGRIFRYTRSDTSGSWTQVLGEASDIAVGPSGIAWIVGVPSLFSSTGFNGVYVWNEQCASTVGNPDPVGRATWRLVGMPALNISTDSLGFPYIVNASRIASWPF